jgi:cytochrome b
MRTLRIWDLPTRLFHWGLAWCVVALIVTSKLGDDFLDWHARLGYTVFSLLAFRLIWGVAGGRWSRFAQFVPSPQRLKGYLTGRYVSVAGHNPLGALSVLAMLAVLLVQVLSGMMINDEDAGFIGPLYPHVPGWLSDRAGAYHEGIGQWLIYALVALHVSAVAWHVKRHNPQLVRAMLTGDQEVADDVPPSSDGLGTRLFALACWLLCAAGVIAMVNP